MASFKDRTDRHTLLELVYESRYEHYELLEDKDHALKNANSIEKAVFE